MDIEEKLLRKMVASCDCTTKSPEVQYHDEMCLYRVLDDAVSEIIHLKIEEKILRKIVVSCEMTK
jgi:hypothetical protein